MAVRLRAMTGMGTSCCLLRGCVPAQRRYRRAGRPGARIIGAPETAAGAHSRCSAGHDRHGPQPQPLGANAPDADQPWSSRRSGNERIVIRPRAQWHDGDNDDRSRTRASERPQSICKAHVSVAPHRQVPRNCYGESAISGWSRMLVLRPVRGGSTSTIQADAVSGSVKSTSWLRALLTRGETA